jgi:hypothetical protein
MIIHKNFVRKIITFISNSKTKELFLIDPISKHRILHRRIHSDPVFNFNNPMTSSQLFDTMKSTKENNSPNVSYFPIEGYGSSYDSRTGSFLSIEQSLPIEINRPSTSSEITIIDEKEIENYQPTRSSTTSESTNDNTIRSKYF